MTDYVEVAGDEDSVEGGDSSGAWGVYGGTSVGSSWAEVNAS